MNPEPKAMLATHNLWPVDDTGFRTEGYSCKGFNGEPLGTLLLLLSALTIPVEAGPSAGSEAPKTPDDVKKAVTAPSLAALVNQPNRQLYLSADSSSKGDGSSVKSRLPAGRPELFDKYVRQYGEQTTFHLAPGTYLTMGSDGSSAKRNVFKGAQVIGAGMDNTVIRLDPSASARAESEGSAPGLAIFSNSGDASGFTMAGLTLDCNAMQNALYLSGFSGGSGASLVALRNLSGSNITIYGVQIKGFGCSFKGPRENFALYMSSTPKTQNDWVSYCIFTEVAEKQTDGDTICTVRNPVKTDTVLNSGVRNCWFGNNKTVWVNRPKYLQAITANGCQCLNNYADESTLTGWYTEPGSGGDTWNGPSLVKGNVFLGKEGVFVRCHPVGTHGSLVVDGNVLAAGIMVFAGPGHQGPVVPRLEVKNNVFPGKTITKITAGAVGTLIDGGGNVAGDGTPVSPAALQAQE
jgi:hypothetical protein